MWSTSNGVNTTYGPTKSHKKYLDIANKMLLDIEINYKKIEKAIKPLEFQLKNINAPKIKE